MTGKPWVDETCGDCRFWEGDRGDRALRGRCCRRAPSVLADWKLTDDDDWCGEWVKRDE